MSVKALPAAPETFSYRFSLVNYSGSFNIPKEMAGPEIALLEARMRDAYDVTKQNIARILFSNQPGDFPNSGVLTDWPDEEWEEMAV